MATGLLLSWVALQTSARDLRAGACGAKWLFTPPPSASIVIVTRHQDGGHRKASPCEPLSLSHRIINPVPGSRHFE